MEIIHMRRGPSTPLGTAGEMFRNGSHLCFTMERPWLDNAKGVSCIPPGRYPCKTYQSPTKGDVWMLVGVPDRSEIEIHAANIMTELRGCIAVGSEKGLLGGYLAVFHSRDTMKLLKATLPAEFILEIH